MKRFMLAVSGLTLLQACQEPTSPPVSPPATSPQVSDLGVAGVTSSTAPQLWAVVDFNGTLIRGSGVSAVTRIGPGRYEVRFVVNVRNCFYVATTRPTYTTERLLVYTASGHLSLLGVYVETRTQANRLIDGRFNLVVSCGAAQTIRGAAVGYTGLLVRASPGTTLFNSGFGRYTIRFTSAVSGCAFIATVADPARARVAIPAMVMTASRLDAFSVLVETRSNTGLLRTGVPFHLVLVCPLSPQSRFAVVRAAGTAQRASAGTTSSKLLSGRYRVSSNRALNTCAAVATRGSVGTIFPFPPGTVEIAPSTAVNNVVYQVRRLQSAGGGSVDADAHVAMVC